MSSFDLFHRARNVIIAPNSSTAVVGGQTVFQGNDIVILDASIQEDHEFDSEITSYPVETGPNVSDNQRPLPAMLTLDAFVSNYPVAFPGTFNPLAVATHGEDAFATLKKFRDQATLLTVLTTLQLYQNMLLKTVSPTRNKGNTNGVRMKIVLQEIFTASTSLVAAPKPRNPSGNALQSKGQVSTGTASAAQETSLVTKGLSFLGRH